MGTTKTDNIRVRVTSEQKQIILAKADAAGLSLSDFVRMAAMTFQVPGQEPGDANPKSAQDTAESDN